MDIEEKFNNDLKETTTLLGFLIIQPRYIESMIESSQSKIMIENLVRVKCAKLWAGNMERELKSKTTDEIVNSVEDLFKLIEVNKK